MLLNFGVNIDSIHSPFPLMQTLRSIGVCSQYLRAKVAFRLVLRKAIKTRWPQLNWLKLVIGGVAGALLLTVGASHAEAPPPQKATQKQVAMPIEMIELLGELDGDDADLDAAIAAAESQHASVKPQKPKSTSTDNSNKGAQ